jgi:hypothetical protein
MKANENVASAIGEKRRNNDVGVCRRKYHRGIGSESQWRLKSESGRRRVGGVMKAASRNIKSRQRGYKAVNKAASKTVKKTQAGLKAKKKLKQHRRHRNMEKSAAAWRMAAKKRRNDHGARKLAKNRLAS